MQLTLESLSILMPLRFPTFVPLPPLEQYCSPCLMSKAVVLVVAAAVDPPDVAESESVVRCCWWCADRPLGGFGQSGAKIERTLARKRNGPPLKQKKLIRRVITTSAFLTNFE